MQDRKYLEALFADDWIAEGNSLASTIFDRHPHIGLSKERRVRLASMMCSILKLISLSERTLDGDTDFRPLPDDATDWPVAPTAVSGPIEQAGPAVIFTGAREPTAFRQFELGTRLRFADGRISSLATVREGTVVLHSGSGIYMQTSSSVGHRFKALHSEFLTAARVVGDGEIGVARVAIATRTAASLIKLVTGGRTHEAGRWGIT